MRGLRTKSGHFAQAKVNRKIRRLTREALKHGGEDAVIVPTPYTD